MRHLRSLIQASKGFLLPRILPPFVVALLLLGQQNIAQATDTIITFSETAGLVTVNCIRMPPNEGAPCFGQNPLSNIVLGNESAHAEFDFLEQQNGIFLAPDPTGFRYIFALTNPGQIADLITVTVPTSNPVSDVLQCQSVLGNAVQQCFSGNIIQLDFASGDANNPLPPPPFVTASYGEWDNVFIDVAQSSGNTQFYQFDIVVQHVPAPATLLLIVGGLALLSVADLIFRRKKYTGKTWQQQP